jgi:hypothetical protein
MKTLERIDNFRRLWGAILPKPGQSVISGMGVGMTRHLALGCPDDSQVFIWVTMADDDVIEHGLKRLRAKILQAEIVTAESAGRYLTAVLRAETVRRRTRRNDATDSF